MLGSGCVRTPLASPDSLLARARALLNRHLDGRVPTPRPEERDQEVIETGRSLLSRGRPLVENLRFHAALEEVRQFVRRLNRYFNDEEPWMLARDPGQKERLGTVLYNIVEGLRIVSVLLEPAMPRKAREISHVFNALTQSYEPPIYVKSLRPARDTCEQCHNPEKFSSDTFTEIKRYHEDEANTETRNFLIVKTGGGTERELMAWLIVAALALLFIDMIAVLAMSGQIALGRAAATADFRACRDIWLSGFGAGASV